MVDRLFAFIEEAPVTHTIAAAFAEYARFDDLYNGVTWRLARDPYPSKATEVLPGIYAVRADPPKKAGFCELMLVYSVDDDLQVITIVDIKIDPLDKIEPLSIPD
jgi:hypothetical protein